jgi:hypothetical protein
MLLATCISIHEFPSPNHSVEREGRWGRESQESGSTEMKMTLPMKKNLIGALILGSITICLAYTRLTDSPWDFWNNLFATAMGVAIGVPIAFAINRHQAAKEEDRRAGEKETKARKVKGLLKKELEDDLLSLRGIHGDANNSGSRQRVFQRTFPLKYELWRTFSDGGEIQWIDSPDVLDALATAYHEIIWQAGLQNRLLDIAYLVGTIQEERVVRQTELFARIQGSIDRAIISVERAVEEIELR